MIDLYCERLGPGVWAEPVNAVTNLAFLLTAWMAWRVARARRTLSVETWLLIGLTAFIAVGSGLFHTLATAWAHVLDVVPILLFQLAFVWAYCRRVIGLRLTYVAGILFAYLLTALSARQFPQLLNGSLAYAPALVVLLALGAYHQSAGRVKPLLLLGASAVFLGSLVFRTVDGIVCPYFPLGTHFLWHLFNAGLLYLLILALITNIQRPGRTDTRE